DKILKPGAVLSTELLRLHERLSEVLHEVAVLRYVVPLYGACKFCQLRLLQNSVGIHALGFGLFQEIVKNSAERNGVRSAYLVSFGRREFAVLQVVGKLVD